MRYLFFIILYACCCLQIHAAVKSDDVIIDSVAYDYELRKNGTKLDCSGTLTVYLQIPTDAKHIIFNRDNPDANRGDNVFLGIKSLHSPSESVIVKSDIKWDSHFSIRVILENDENIESYVHDVKYYISPADLSLLNETVENEFINSDVEPAILFNNKQLCVSVSEYSLLNITDISGNILFSGIVENEAEIPIAASVIIVNIRSKNHSLTKKLLMR